MEGGNVTPSTGGWGETFNFTVNVSDPQGDVVNISTWIFKTGWSNWFYLNYTEINTSEAGCTSSKCTVYIDYTGFVGENISTYNYRFNATDGTYINSLESGSFILNIEKNDLGVINNLDKLPYPDYSQFDLDLYLTPKRILPLQTARGCSWRKCAFCSHHAIDLGNYKTFSIIKSVFKVI